MLAFALVATKMIETRASRPDPLDVRGALLLAGGITALLLSVLQRAGGAPLPGGLRIGLITGGVGLLVLFAREQARLEHPLVPPDLFRHARTMAPYVAGALLGHDHLRRRHLRAALRARRARRARRWRRERW